MTGTESAIEVEQIVVRLRRHARRLVLPVVLLIALAAASGFWVGGLPEPWMNWVAGGAAILLALVVGIGPILSWLATRIIVTDRRVILRRGLFVHHRSEVPLSRVREVRSRRGPGQRMFGSGDVELVIGADAPTVLRDVPAPGVLVDAIQELIERGYARADATGRVGLGGPPAMPFPDTTVLGPGDGFGAPRI